MRFCQECDNYLSLYVKTDESSNKQKLIYKCVNCNNTEEYNENNSNCIYENYYNSNNLFVNEYNTQYLEDDHTLPRVNNIPCPNADCPTNSLEQKKSKKNINEVIYIIINESTMTYQYKCCNCKTTWKNK